MHQGYSHVCAVPVDNYLSLEQVKPESRAEQLCHLRPLDYLHTGVRFAHRNLANRPHPFYFASGSVVFTLTTELLAECNGG